MNKKLIGIPMWIQGDKSIGIHKTYAEYFKNFGTVIALSPDSYLENLDLLVLPGGKDILPSQASDFSYYNSDNEALLGWFDRFTLPMYINNNTPIYGICRGAQAIFDYYGMELIPNIWWGHGTSKNEADLEAHDIEFTDFYKDFFTKKIGKSSMPKKIESFHHQGLLVKDLNTEVFDLIGYSLEQSKDYRIVEYAKHIEKPIICQQGHPERTWAPIPNYLIQALLEKEKIN